MSGYQVSPFGNASQNALFDPLMARRQTQYDTNDLLSQQTIGSNNTEMAARIAQTLVATNDDAKAAELYPRMIADAQQQGFLRHLGPQPVWPGMEHAKRVAALGTSSAEQYKQQGVAGAVDAYGNVTGISGVTPGTTTGAPAGGGGATGQARLLPGETEDQFLARIEQRESGGRNVMNFRNKENPSYYTAGGYYQIVDSTWKAGAQAAGIDISQYPTAISAPREVQTAVARSILRNFGPQHWDQSEPGTAQQANVAPGTAPGRSAPPPGVQMGGAPPGPPGAAPRPYVGGGFGTALNPVAPVVQVPPASGGGTASNVPGDVNAMLGGIAQAQNTPVAGVQTAGPGAPTGGAQVASVELPPQPGWGTSVGSYGNGAAAAPPAGTSMASPSQVAAQQAQATGKPVEIPGGNGAWALPNGNITRLPPPASTTQQPPPATAPAQMPAQLQTDNNYLTERDKRDLKPLFDQARRGQIPLTTLQNEVQQRQSTNYQRQKDWETRERQREQDAGVARREERQIEATERQIAATEAKLKQDAIDGKLKTDKQQFDEEDKLRDEFGAHTAGFRVIQGAYENIRSSSKVGDGASDMSMLYSYIHLLDPTTGIKESEFSGAAASGSWGDKVKGAVNTILTGGRLSDNLRQNFVRESKNLYENARKGHDLTADQYETLAKKYGLDPTRVATRFTRPQDDGPKVGTIEDGYRYKGGDPAKPGSWEKVP